MRKPSLLRKMCLTVLSCRPEFKEHPVSGSYVRGVKIAPGYTIRNRKRKVDRLVRKKNAVPGMEMG